MNNNPATMVTPSYPSVHHAAAAAAAANCGKIVPVSAAHSMYELSAQLLNGRGEQFSRYEGRITLVVNIATCDTRCKQELLQLNEIMEHFGHKFFNIVCFPCNQFGKLEPLGNDEILLFLKNIRPGCQFVPKFTIFCKTEINGRKAHPVYEFLKMRLPFPSDDDGKISRDNNEITWYPITRYDVSWNFEKFLVSYDGTPVKRYTYKTTTDTLKKDIEVLIRRIPKSIRELKELHHFSS